MAIVETVCGPVEGRVKNDLVMFAGIPYAAAPVGERRFCAAEPHESWEAVRSCVSFGPAAPQLQGQGMTDSAPVRWHEDCLFLNVQTPAPDDARRPVLVWIHGGAYRTGQGAIPWYDGGSFVHNGDIVVVSINYRLGALGFTDLSHIDDRYATSGVNGILDQIMALRWVQENIANFGGDPQRVTIAGESAGGFSVATLLGCEQASGLFAQAIPQSGAAHHTLTPEAGRQVSDLFIETLGGVERLHEATPDEILAVQNQVDQLLMTGKVPFDGAGVSPFYPVVGNPVLPESPLTAIRRGVGSQVPVLTGTNKDEASLFIMGDVDDGRLAKDAVRYGGGEALLNAYRDMYPDASNRDLAVAMSTDFSFRIPALRLADARADASAATWMYFFTWESRNAALKATHALEIPFAFNNLDKAGVAAFLGRGESPQAVADAMHTAWTRFICSGDPGWPAYDNSAKTNMVFDTQSATISAPDEARLAAWQGLR